MVNFNNIKKIKQTHGIKFQDASQTNTWWCVGYQPPEYRQTADKDYMVYWVKIAIHSNSAY